MNDKPFALIGVNSDRDLAKIRQIVIDKELNWRSFQNQPEGATESIAAAWAVRGWPTLVVIDADFKIRHRSHDGDKAAAIARELVAKLVAEKAARKHEAPPAGR